MKSIKIEFKGKKYWLVQGHKDNTEFSEGFGALKNGGALYKISQCDKLGVPKPSEMRMSYAYLWQKDDTKHSENIQRLNVLIGTIKDIKKIK